MTVKNLVEKLNISYRFNKIKNISIYDIEEKQTYDYRKNIYYNEYNVRSFYVLTDYTLVIEAEMYE